MVLPIGFFMPLPLAMMIPFMGIQSAVMAKQFGENFQYGKRRISAMSNDEFNKLTPKMIQDNANAELKAMIPSMEQSVIEMRTFQTFLIKEFMQMLNDAIKAGFGKLFGVDDEAISAIEHFIHGHGYPAHTTGTTSEPSELSEPSEPNRPLKQPSSGGFKQPTIPSDPRVKLKPGQTQINHRDSLIKQIAFLGKVAFSQKSKPGLLVITKKKLLAKQQELVNLLKKYNFL